MSNDSHFLIKCYIASLGFRVIPGAIYNELFKKYICIHHETDGFRFTTPCGIPVFVPYNPTPEQAIICKAQQTLIVTMYK